LSQSCDKIKIGYYICHKTVAKFLRVSKDVTKKIKMKEGFNPREVLGLTQDQIAILLNVSRSHWAMYERGERDLPTSAFLVLGDIMAYAQTVAAKSAPKTEQQPEQAAALHVSLQKMLKENQYQREHLARKLALLERKQEAQGKALQLAAYLKAKNPNAKERETQLLNRINAKATKGVTHKMLLQIIKWQIKLEMLQVEKRLLEERIGEEG
jgi:transcriptional regulator with XRE-family HTH domain